MFILDKLWSGEVSPSEQTHRPVSDYDPYLRRQEECERLLKAELSDAGKQVFEEFLQAEGSVDCLGFSDSFAAGVRMGVLMMLDVFLPGGRCENGKG